MCASEELSTHYAASPPGRPAPPDRLRVDSGNRLAAGRAGRGGPGVALRAHWALDMNHMYKHTHILVGLLVICWCSATPAPRRPAPPDWLLAESRNRPAAGRAGRGGPGVALRAHWALDMNHMNKHTHILVGLLVICWFAASAAM